MNDTIGIFYEMPDGRIAKTYAWNGGANTIHYYLEDHIPCTVAENEWVKWKPRRDITSFQLTNDPPLPKIFDMLWGLKRWSDLDAALKSNHESLLMIRDAMRSHSISEVLIAEKLNK